MRRSSSAVIELIGPVVMCFAAVLVTTLLLSTIDSFVPTDRRSRRLGAAIFTMGR